MANNLIQIKRTSVSGRAANTSTLQNAGELALNMADGILYSSNGSSVFEIGANNTNVNITGNATIKAVIANGGIGSAGQVLTSGGTGANAYWSTVSGGGSSYTFANGVANNSGTVSVVANTGLVSNSSGVFVNSAYIATLASNTSNTANTANNASYLGGVAAASYVNNSQLSSNLANYAALAGATFTGDVTVNANLIVTGTTVTLNTATLDVKDKNITVAKGVASAALADGAGLTVDTANIGWYYNNASNTWQSNVGITPASNATYNLGSATLHWSNLYVKAIYANGSIGTAGQVLATNGSAIYWTADQGSNAITSNTLTSNYISVSTGTLTVGNSTVNTDIGNNYVSVGNSTGYVNVYSSYIYLGNTTANATINSTTYTGSANNASYLGGIAAASYVNSSQLSSNLANYVNTSGNYTLSGNLTFNANLVIGSAGDLYINAAAGIWANGGFGTAGQVLTTNASAVYWSTITSGGANVDAQYTWTNTHSFTNTTASGNATSGAVKITGGLGVANNIYTAGRVGWSNSTNVSVVYQQYNSTTGSLDVVFG